MNRGEQDYVLGTHREELERLGLQHRVWRPTVLDCWRRAGIERLLDLGRVSEAWASSVRREIEEREADAGSLMLTPMILEIITERV